MAFGIDDALLISGAVLGAGGEAAKGFGSQGSQRIELSRPPHANIAAGLIAPRYIPAIYGYTPSYIQDQINQFWAKLPESLGSHTSVPSTAVGRYISQASQNLNQLLTKTAYEALGAPLNYSVNASNAAAQFAMRGRESRSPQHEVYRQDPFTTAGNVISAAATPYIYKKYLTTKKTPETDTQTPTGVPSNPYSDIG